MAEIDTAQPRESSAPSSLLGVSLLSYEENHFFKWFHLTGVEPLPTPENRVASFRPSGERFHDRTLVQVRADERVHVGGITLMLDREFIDSTSDGSFARDIAKSLITAAVPETDLAQLARFHGAVSDFAASGAPVIMHADAPRGGAEAASEDPAYQTFLGLRSNWSKRLSLVDVSVENRTVDRKEVFVLTLNLIDRSVPVVLDRDDSLMGMIRNGVRSAADRQLVIALVAGAVACGVMLATRPQSWQAVFSAGIAVASVGAWGMLDREAEGAIGGSGLVRALKSLVAMVGFLALLGLAFSLVSLVLGTWKS